MPGALSGDSGAGLGLGLGLGQGAALLGLGPAPAVRTRRLAAVEGDRAAAALARSLGRLLRPVEVEEAAALARAR